MKRSPTARRKVPAQAFLFQSRVDTHDLRTELHAKSVVARTASRYRTAMRPGDIVYFWLAGSEEIRGIYGWGSLRRVPYRRANDVRHKVDGLVEQVITKPILAST